MDSANLRDATLDDTDAILALWGAAYAGGRSHFDDIPALLSHGGSSRILLAEADGRIAGSLITTFDGWRGNMYRLAVHPDFQRRGIARDLVDEAHTWLRAQGCRRITALVEGDHDYATGFWESAGYSHDAGMRRYTLEFD